MGDLGSNVEQQWYEALMSKRLIASFSLVSHLLMGSLAVAATWYVAKDGSGDYTTIQPAVDGAAAGDTIMIGPGRYTEYAPFTVPGWTEDTYVAIQTSDLVLNGTGSDVTIIGPETPIHSPGERPKGIAAVFLSNLTVQNLTVENIRDGIYRSEGHMGVRDCSFHGCDFGIVAWTDGGMLVDRCKFTGNISAGIITHGPANDIEVWNSHFENLSGNISFNATTNANVHCCTFSSGTTGTKHQSYSQGGVFDCEFQNIQNVAIDVAIVSTATLDGNLISGGAANLYLSTNSHVQGTGNRLRGGTYATILVSHSTMDFHGNHILHGEGPSVYLETFLNPPNVIIDLADNYWGTTSSDSIAAWIWDGHDNFAIHAFVEYEPFASSPIGADHKSWGAVKNLYR